MTRSVLMYERYYHDRQARKYHLQYYLLIDEVCFGCNTLDVYGAKIIAFRDGAFLEQKVIRGITPFGPKITALITRLSDSLCEPGGMEKIIHNAPSLKSS